MKHALRSLLGTTLRTVDLGLLLLRVWVGAVLALEHGWGKVSDLGTFTSNIAARVPFAGVLAPAAALSEFAGGLLLVVGLATRPAAAFILATMSVAVFRFHAADPFGKKELALAYGVAALALLVAGPGRLSADARLFGSKPD